MNSELEDSLQKYPETIKFATTSDVRIYTKEKCKTKGNIQRQVVIPHFWFSKKGEEKKTFKADDGQQQAEWWTTLILRSKTDRI